MEVTNKLSKVNKLKDKRICMYWSDKKISIKFSFIENHRKINPNRSAKTINKKTSKHKYYNRDHVFGMFEGFSLFWVNRLN